jgi:hypothetical protein
VSRLPEAKLELRRKRMEAVSAHRSRRVDASRRRADLSGRLSRRRAAQAVAEAEAEAAAERESDEADAMAPEDTDVTNPEIETEEDFAAEGGTEGIVVDEANSEDDTAEAPADADEKGE